MSLNGHSSILADANVRRPHGAAWLHHPGAGDVSVALHIGALAARVVGRRIGEHGQAAYAEPDVWAAAEDVRYLSGELSLLRWGRRRCGCGRRRRCRCRCWSWRGAGRGRRSRRSWRGGWSRVGWRRRRLRHGVELLGNPDLTRPASARVGRDRKPDRATPVSSRARRHRNPARRAGRAPRAAADGGDADRKSPSAWSDCVRWPAQGESARRRRLAHRNARRPDDDRGGTGGGHRIGRNAVGNGRFALATGGRSK
jgi:hypothetical protein